MTTQAEAPSENWLALPAAITPPGVAGADLRHGLVGGIGADTFIGVHGDLASHEPTRVLVGYARGDFDGHDLVLELAGRLRRLPRAAGSARRNDPATRGRCV